MGWIDKQPDFNANPLHLSTPPPTQFLKPLTGEIYVYEKILQLNSNHQKKKNENNNIHHKTSVLKNSLVLTRYLTRVYNNACQRPNWDIFISVTMSYPNEAST